LKEKERKGKKEDKGILDGVPASLPALSQAQEYQDRAARVGFDWPEIEGVLDKIREEIEEIKQAQNLEQVTGELGDLFFVLVNLARWRKVDAESALREANLKFKKRFAYVEKSAKEQGRNLSDMTLEEMDAFWERSETVGDVIVPFFTKWLYNRTEIVQLRHMPNFLSRRVSCVLISPCGAKPPGNSSKWMIKKNGMPWMSFPNG
jgi:NTP pyrophosphatase (non-canonical NTP hydrolase)